MTWVRSEADPQPSAAAIRPAFVIASSSATMSGSARRIASTTFAKSTPVAAFLDVEDHDPKRSRGRRGAVSPAGV